MQQACRVIVVDDEAPQLEALCALLEERGFWAQGFSNPKDAIEIIAAERFDLLLTDLRLPGLSGIELIRQARAYDPDLGAILMTGYGSIESVVDAMKVGVLDYIQKPFKVADLLPVIERARTLTELKRENSKLLADVSNSNERLLEVNRELDSFAGRVAHDLNSMCHIIQGFAGSLSRRAQHKLDEQEQRYLMRIAESSERGGLLVASLLAFARLGSGELHYSAVSLNEVVQKIRATLEADEEQARAEWSVDNLPDIQADEQLIEQVFLNLFSNALKFTKNVASPAITVQAEQLQGEVEIVVTDNGVGFDPDRADGLFKPFYRLHNAHDFNGHGLGLANVKRIVERHGGTVQGFSSPGNGASFSVRLPVEQPRSTEPAADSVFLHTAVHRNNAGTGQKNLGAQRMELLDACIERLNDIVMITEADSIDSPGPRIVYVNSAFERLTGYTRDEVIGKSPRLLQGPETDRKQLDRVRQALSSRQSIQVELLNYGKSGKPHWLEMDIVPVVSPDGNVPYFASIQRDITDKRKAEEKQRRDEALHKIGARLAKIGAWAIDLTPVVRLYWSEEIFTMLELPEGKLPTTMEEGLCYYQGKWRAQIEQALERCSLEGTAFEMEPEIRTATGRRFWARVVGEAVRNHNGDIVRIQGAFQDITESKVALLTLMHMNRLLEAQHRVNELTSYLKKPDTLLQKVCSVFCSLGGMPLAWACRIAPEDGALSVIAVDGADQEFVARIMRSTTLPSDHQLVQRLRNGQLYVCQNVAEEPQAYEWHQYAIEEGLESFAILPIHARGELLASLVLFGEGVFFFTNEVRQLLRTVSKNLSIAMENLLYSEEQTQDRKKLLLLETCVERLNDIVLITEAEPIDGDGPKILYVNDAFERRTGYTREEAIGQTPRMLQGELTQRDALDRIRAALKEWRPVREELINYTKSGQAFWLELDIVPVADDTGWYTHWVAIERDITERKTAEAALKEGAERFRLLASAAKDCIWDWNLITDDMWWNEGFETLFGFDRKTLEPNNDSWMNRLHPDDRERAVASIFAAINSTRENWQDEYRFAHQDGHWVDVLDRGYLIRDDQGKAIRMIGAMTDMTHIRRSERRSNAQLMRMSLLNEITRAIGQRHDLDSIYHVVTNSIEIELPADFCFTASYQAKEDLLTFRSFGDNTLPKAREMGVALHKPVQIKGENLQRALHGEFVYQTAMANVCDTGTQLSQRFGLGSMVFAPLKKEDGTVLGLIAAGRLAAEAFSEDELDFLRQLAQHMALALAQTELLQELQQAYEHLQQTQQLVLQQERLRALAEMAGGIAHDINNAISPVALYTEALLSGEKALTERGKKQLKTIQLAIDDVAQTVDRMSQFSKGKEDSVLVSSVNLKQVCEQTVELTRARWFDMAQRSGIHIDFKLEHEDEHIHIETSESELREALINLVFNAVDAMPEGGTLTLRTQWSADRQQVMVQVKDTGTGMSEETQRRCMEPFYTTKGERGTGLGLAMVYGIVKRMHGQLDIVSTPGEGTTIQIEIPVKRGLSKTAPSPTGVQHPGRAAHLLLIDDDQSVLEALSDGLKTLGHVVQCAKSGDMGLKLFDQAHQAGQAFDAVICDLGMPGMDGREVAKAIKTRQPKCPVLLLTGWGKQLESDSHTLVHVDKLLSKPPRLTAIADALNELHGLASDPSMQSAQGQSTS
jgi:PAS domain S-box-containing protein